MRTRTVNAPSSSTICAWRRVKPKPCWLLRKSIGPVQLNGLAHVHRRAALGICFHDCFAGFFRSLSLQPPKQEPMLELKRRLDSDFISEPDCVGHSPPFGKKTRQRAGPFRAAIAKSLL